MSIGNVWLKEFRPAEYKVLVLPDKIEEITKSGIVIPKDATDKEQMAQVLATIISVGGNAFEDWIEKPQAGDRVTTAKYAGVSMKGSLLDKSDENEYRIINDKDITGIIGANNE